MLTGQLNTKEKVITAGIEAKEFFQSISGRTIFANIAAREAAAVKTLTGIQPSETLEAIGSKAVYAAAQYQLCQNVRSWFRQLEDESRKAQAET